jgi:hypothetical protein
MRKEHHMPKFISRLYIVVEAGSDAEAADAMSACLSENLKCGGHIVDWAYSATGNVYDHPMPLVADAPDDLEEADMDSLFTQSLGDRDNALNARRLAAVNLADMLARMSAPSDFGDDESDASLIEDDRLMNDAAALWGLIHQARDIVKKAAG